MYICTSRIQREERERENPSNLLVGGLPLTQIRRATRRRQAGGSDILTRCSSRREGGGEAAGWQTVSAGARRCSRCSFRCRCDQRLLFLAMLCCRKARKLCKGVWTRQRREARQRSRACEERQCLLFLVLFTSVRPRRGGGKSTHRSRAGCS